MEWLAGGRMPSWASPYSDQATAALKAQFPTQWPTIRDYGFAHPEIVGYMNAYAPKDAKIAYSLVEGIGWRCIMGDQNHFYNTGIICSDCSVEFNFRTMLYPTNGDAAVFLAASSGWQYDAYALFCRKNNRIIAYHGNEQQFLAFAENTRYKFTTDYSTKVGTLTNLDTGATKSIANLDLNPTNQNGLKVLALNSSYSTTAGFESLKVNNNGRDYWFVPIKRNGVMEIIDLLSGDLCTRAVTLPEEIFSETPAS